MSSIYFHRGIITVWEARGLDWEFRKQWLEAERTRFLPLYDTMPADEQPFPFCIFTVDKGEVEVRMSGPGSRARELDGTTAYNKKMHIRRVPLIFEILASPRGSDSRDAKTIAEDLALKVMSVYGGHPDPETYGSPAEIPLAFGKVLQLEYANDFGEAESDSVYRWTISYEALIDTPVAI